MPILIQIVKAFILNRVVNREKCTWVLQVDRNSKRTAKLFRCLPHILERHFLPESLVSLLGTKFKLVLDYLTTFEEAHEELYVFFSIFKYYALYFHI